MASAARPAADTGHSRQLTLIATKLRAPAVKSHAIPRPRLLGRLRTGDDRRVCLIACPAGFGKTSLLAQWREEEATRRALAWVTIDGGDNDPVVLWSHILEALRRVCPEIGIAPGVIGAGDLTSLFLPRLVNALEDQGEAVLILDDVHQLAAGAATQSVAWFIEHAPATVRLVISTRSDPPLRLAAQRARGELLELRASDLQFTTDEAERFLNGRLALDLSTDDVRTLVERTSGWPAGLYLAALSLERQTDRHAAVRAFDVSSRPVVDYLLEEVLEAHDASAQTLLRRSSILERLSGPLCDAVTASAGSDELLRAISHSNLFLAPLDDEAGWYQIHPVFARLMRVELEQRDPGLAPTLHRRASAWHRDNGTLDDAVHHAIEAGAFAEAAEAITASWIRYFNSHRNASVLRWLDRLPQEVVGGDSQLLLVKAWLLATTGRHEEAAFATAAVLRLGRLADGPLRDGFNSVEASLTTLAALYPGDAAGAGVASGLRAAELEGVSSPWRPLVCAALGRNFYMLGQVREATQWLEEGTFLAQERAQWAAGAATLAFRSYIAGDEDRLAEQSALAGEGLRLIRAHGLEQFNGHVHLAHALSLAARRQSAEALAAVELGIAVGRVIRHPLDLALGLLKAAQVFRAVGRRADEAAALAEAGSIIDSCADPGGLKARLVALERSRGVRSRSRDRALSRGELRVLELLDGELSERDIGTALYLSPNTVHTHTRSIYRKLGVSSRAAAVGRARELGLLHASPAAPQASRPTASAPE